jgi:hypothetical protein
VGGGTGYDLFEDRFAGLAFGEGPFQKVIAHHTGASQDLLLLADAVTVDSNSLGQVSQHDIEIEERFFLELFRKVGPG